MKQIKSAAEAEAHPLAHFRPVTSEMTLRAMTYATRPRGHMAFRGLGGVAACPVGRGTKRRDHARETRGAFTPLQVVEHRG